MTISFKYKALKRANGLMKQSPVIPITIIGRSQFARPEVIALLDSGADVSVIPKDLADLIDLELPDKTDISRGIGGEVEVKNTKMKIHIKKGHNSEPFEIPVQVVLGQDSNKIPMILGREGFFDKFKITFDQTAELVTLKPINENRY